MKKCILHRAGRLAASFTAICLVLLPGLLRAAPGSFHSPPEDTLNCIPAMVIEWQKSFGGTKKDIPYDMSVTADGGYIIVGQTASANKDVTGNHGATDYWVIRLNASGQLEWKQCFGGIATDEAYAVEVTSDHGFVIAGGARSNNGNVTNNHGNYDFWIIRLDSLGNLLWQRALGGNQNDVAYDVKQTVDGGFIAVGYSKSKNGDVSLNYGLGDYWIVKLDGNGLLQWQKVYGGSSHDFAKSVTLAADGGYFVSGYCRSADGSTPGNNGEEDLLLLKLDSQGNLLWQVNYGDGAGEGTSSMVGSSDGGLLSVGITHSTTGLSSGNHGEHDYWLIKTDASGSLNWSKCLGGNITDDGNAIARSGGGTYLVAGDSRSVEQNVCFNHGNDDAWIVCLDSTGNILWQNSLGGSASDGANAIVATADGGYAVACYSSSNNGDVTGNKGSMDFWIVKMKPAAMRSVISAEGESKAKPSVSVFPSPASGRVQLVLSGFETRPQAALIELTDLRGQLLWQQNVFMNDQPLNITFPGSISDGRFLLTVTSGNQTASTAVIILKN
jgi:hypothetical protein